MTNPSRLARSLLRQRRDVFDDCEDEWGSSLLDCMCRNGDETWCNHNSDYIRGISMLAVVGIIAGVLALVACCVACLCCRRRRNRGTVFRTASGRTTTTVVTQPTTGQTTHTGAALLQNTHQAQPGGYPAPQSGYPAQQQVWSPPQQGGYPQPQGGYQQPQGGYPQQQGGYPPQQGGYPPQQGGYPPQQGGFASGANDLPPPYQAAGRQEPYNPQFQDDSASGGDTKRPL